MPKRLLAAVVLVLAVILLTLIVAVFLPSPGQLVRQQPATSSAIYDRTGVPLYYFYKSQHRIPVPLTLISQSAIDATLAIEDRHFFHHYGFSFRGILRAVYRNYSAESAAEGGSTLTQQLVKNRLLSRDKRVVRKLKELFLSIWVELVFSKKEILAMYLNDASYGGTVYGIEAAAWKYFNKSASALTLGESAMLAGLLKAPSVYSPLGSQPKLAVQRQRQVLNAMLDADFISRQQFEYASGTEPRVAPGTVKILAPHFVMYVRDLLLKKYGADRLYNDGLQITTTLDLALHNDTQDLVTSDVRKFFRYRVGNGAALITRPRTGEILSMVGSVDYFDKANDGQVNVTLRYRQPGSSIKPLTYAMSLEAGKTALSQLEDQPVEYAIPNEENYRPRNDDRRFHGTVSLRQALASSYNIPAVKQLAEVGVMNFVEKAREAGITNWADQNPYRYALTLGSAEVRVLDLAQLYSTFANRGSSVAPNPLLEVTDIYGNVLYKNDCSTDITACQNSAIFSSQTAFLISDILSDNAARAPSFGYSSDLNIRGQQVAVKTGTSNFLRDNWAIGYTSDILIAVWIGNNDGRSMRLIHSGSHGASSIWYRLMRKQLINSSVHIFPVPDGIVKVKVCAPTATLTCDNCPLEREEYFVTGTQPKTRCAYPGEEL